MNPAAGKFQNFCGYLHKNQQNSFEYRCGRCGIDILIKNLDEIENHNSDHENQSEDAEDATIKCIRNLFQPIVELMDLNDDCIEAIFKYLSPNDLNAMSSTCSRYKCLAEQTFYRTRDSETVKVIGNGRTIRFDFNHSSKFVENFLSFIRSVDIRLTDSSSIFNTFRFVKANCSSRLLHLNLNGTNLPMSLIKSHGDVIAEQLKHLKTLSINILKFDDIHHLLRHCENLQTLIFEVREYYTTGNRINHNNTWMNETYPKLDNLIIHGATNLFMDLTNFLQNNPQMKAIVCNNLSAMESICVAGTNLPYVAMKFLYERDFLQILDTIVQFGNREHIKSLDLVFADLNARFMSFGDIFRMKFIKGLHIGRMFLNMLDHTTFSSANIERLCVHSVKTTGWLGFEITKYFPNLQEFRFSHAKSQKNCIVSFLKPIIKRMGTLKDIFIDLRYEQFINLTENDLIAFHALRSKLENPSTVTIHLNKRHAKELNGIILDKSLVRIQFEDMILCPLCCDCKQPLVRYLKRINAHNAQ